MENREAWLTPNAPATPANSWWVLSFPKQFEEYVRGALGLLSDFWNWEQSGDMTPDECAYAMLLMWDSISENKLIGSIYGYATATLPDGVLLCDGSVYNRVDYPVLYGLLDDAYIDDEDTFHVPDLVDRSPMGTALSQGQEIGEETHTQTVQELPAHSHTIQHAYGDSVVLGYLGAIEALVPTQSEEETSEVGGGSAFNVVHPVHKMRFGIVAR